MHLFDAHNHLQDDRLRPHLSGIVESLPAAGLVRAVVAGSGEDDWEAVAKLAKQHAWIQPSFGVHPWNVQEQSTDWRENLEVFLRAFPSAGVGEIGLDRWVENHDVPLQVRYFRDQLAIASRDNRPATIHCLQAWGLLEEHLRTSPLPERGFLLHSYGGPPEMVKGFAKMGAYFSVSPYFFHERKARQLATFRLVPADRLLLETDAPDMRPPEALNPHPLNNDAGQPINDPANISMMYTQTAGYLGIPLPELIEQAEDNFVRLFGL